MKHIISISLGSSKRDQRTQTEILGQPIILERIGTNGDLALARQLFLEYDGKVDAFGVGGADLGITVADRDYPLHAIHKLTADLQTPAVDGGMVRRVVEGRFVPRLESLLAEHLPAPIAPKRVLICTAVARYDLACSFHEAGYEAIYGDLGFGLGLPVPIRSLAALHGLARLMLPIMGRLPFEWLYPTGESQEQIMPRFERWYNWASVIADDFHYIKQHLPDRLENKIVVTNTTTESDVQLLRERGVAILCTITPRLEGRSFGTNVMEAALTAIGGKGRPLTEIELEQMLQVDDLTPTVVSF